MARILSFSVIASVQAAMASPAPGAGNRHAEDFAGAVGNDLDVTFGHALGLGAIILPIRPAQYPDGAGIRARLLLEKTHLGQLRIGIDHPRDDLLVNAHRYAEKGVPDHQAGVVVGDVSVFGASGGVAHDVHRLIGGPQRLVEHDTVAGHADAGGVEIEILNIWLTSYRDQKMRTFNGLGAAIYSEHRPALSPKRG